MKRVSNRAAALLILTVLAVAGLSLYILRFAVSGAEWTSFTANRTVYKDGVLRLGTVLDRNGAVLSGVTEEGRYYADDGNLRTATLHAVGDPGGNIGTGALRIFSSRLIGYNIISGAYSRSGEGKKVYLSIDSDLNAAAYKALGGKKGAVAVMNYKTGELLCMVSAPSFDPMNMPDIEGGGDKYEGVYLNRFLSGVYTPGSVYKLVTLAAAIEHIDDLDDRVFTCTGGLKVGGDVVSCTGVHGDITVETALAVSCNSAFGEMALELGADRLAEYAAMFGLTDTIGIDGVAAAAGSFGKGGADTADLAWSGIGQYHDAVCPAGMLRLVSAIANGGVAVDMTQLRVSGLSGLLPGGKERLMKETTAERLATMMSYSVYKTYGEENFPGLELFAKSGTAEVGGGNAPHAWFVGFITNDKAPLAFVVLVENGGSGSRTAGAVANAVLQEAVK